MDDEFLFGRIFFTKLLDRLVKQLFSFYLRMPPLFQSVRMNMSAYETASKCACHTGKKTDYCAYVLCFGPTDFDEKDCKKGTYQENNHGKETCPPNQCAVGIILIGNWFVLFGFHTPHIGSTALCKAKQGSIDAPPND
jgi:hypothetical protein